jgi:hypothetical protein
MNEEEFKLAIQNILMLQNNNDHCFVKLQEQIDEIKQDIKDLNDLKTIFRLPSPSNKDRKLFDVDDTDEAE